MNGFGVEVLAGNHFSLVRRSFDLKQDPCRAGGVFTGMNNEVRPTLLRYQISVFVVDFFQEVHQMHLNVLFAFALVDEAKQLDEVRFEAFSLFPVARLQAVGFFEGFGRLKSGGEHK